MKTKKQLFLCLLGVLMFVGQSHAQQPKVEPQKTQELRRILYSPHVPRAILKQMPNGQKTRFFGSFKLRQNAPTSFVHLYNAADSPKAYSFAPEQKYTLAIFEASGRNQYHLIQKFPLEYQGWGWTPDTFAAHLLWLDPAQEKGPIVKIDAFNPAATYGSSGDNILVVFPQGLSAEPVIQTFKFGAWRASDTSGQQNWFDNLDENGQLQVKVQIHWPTGEIPQPAPAVMHWNGEKFVFNAKQDETESGVQG